SQRRIWAEGYLCRCALHYRCGRCREDRRDQLAGRTEKAIRPFGQCRARPDQGHQARQGRLERFQVPGSGFQEPCWTWHPEPGTWSEATMNIHEYQAKSVLAKFGVPVPRGGVAYTPAEAEQVAQSLGGALWVVKAQIHAGGRGKAGGVKLAKSLDEVKRLTKEMLGMT